MTAGYSKEPVFRKWDEKIYEICQQYFYREKVHTYLFDLEDQVLLFDIPTYSGELQQFILSFGKPVSALISHGSCGISDGTLWQKEIGLKVYAHEKDRSHPWLNMEPDYFFEALPEFAAEIQVIATPGHSAGSVCLLHKPFQALFSGDTLYGNPNGEIRDFSSENMASYESLSDRIASCHQLLNYDFEKIFPFHYEILLEDAREKLRHYLAAI